MSNKCQIFRKNEKNENKKRKFKVYIEYLY